MNVDISIENKEREKAAIRDIVDLLTQARDLAERSNLKFLTYLIQMSLIEARARSTTYTDEPALR